MSEHLPITGSVGDSDIAWVADLLGLGGLDEPRRSFLKRLDTLDVAACPGSGKTTLVVAKLAILARKWSSLTRGVCILSHTNVAREEIQRRLADAAAGHDLLNYPHYVDTIHGFVNRFLASPWLASNGYKVIAVDNEITTSVRKKNLGRNYFKVNAYLDRKHHSFDLLRIGSSDLANPLVGTRFPAGPSAPTYQLMADAMRLTAEQGYFCHDEMFTFAKALLRDHPEISAILSRRFPFVLIDEMQDTSLQQHRLLGSIFGGDPRRTTVQRVGDSNQAIFENDGESGPGIFPGRQSTTLTLPNSFRFDSSIAALASNLALAPVEPSGLQGVERAPVSQSGPQHTIFVFPKDKANLVLPAYAAHVINCLDEETLASGAVTAVGHIHMEKEEVGPGHNQYPATVSHYWNDYRVTASRRAAPPAHLAQCIHKARMMRLGDMPVHEAVNTVAAGFIRFLNHAGASPAIAAGSRPHRSLERVLESQPDARQLYRSILANFVVGDKALDEQAWKSLLPDLLSLGQMIAGGALTAEVSAYAEWREPFAGPVDSSARQPRLNIYHFEDQGRAVDVHLNSIHAVKGQTHVATLVLETFNYGHVLKALMPWIKGDRSGGGTNTGVRDSKRLRLAYVAMTRPSHLLCLALPDSSLGEGLERLITESKLSSRGWKVVELE
ncbi:UvrD-helicase domain-containing protein [Micromonospora rubida]|uniref:UvrD-helicase domain-containing protein n=1 Tax=Micromonospora rubida TaxID=2697657 RepID=A0ABW7SK86_9ACTN